MLTVRTSSVAEFEAAATFPALLDEYAEECRTDGLPPPKARMESYRHLEALGLLHAIGAFVDDELQGFISLIVPTLPHYGIMVGVSESFFVAKQHRPTMAGLKLLVQAEELAQSLGAPGLLVSAPVRGKLFKLMPRIGYAETSRVFFRCFADA